MKDWKWASVRGWPERMMAARSHSISSTPRYQHSANIHLRLKIDMCTCLTFVQIRLIEVIRPGNVHIVKTGDVPVSSKVLQQLDLSQGPLGEDLLAEDIGDLLDGDAFASLAVGRCADDSVSALSKLLCHGVPLVNDEVLVEDLEDLPALQ